KIIENLPVRQAGLNPDLSGRKSFCVSDCPSAPLRVNYPFLICLFGEAKRLQWKARPASWWVTPTKKVGRPTKKAGRPKF
ncbi:MAG: hypothetical protein Q7U21_12780, partial [Lutibacter sp.]|nr:hypothetical protein [Lutibacter sp.]